MQLNLLFSVLAAKLIRAKGLYVPLFTLLLMAIGQAKAQVSIVEGDTAYICQNGRTSQNLTAVTQLGYSYKWYNLDKTVWYQVGSSFGNYYTSYPSLAFKGSTPYVAMKDTINNAKLIVVKYNGTSWEQVGGPIQWGWDQKISFKGDTPFVAFSDMTEGNKNSVYKYDGTNWVKVGNSVGGNDVNANSNFASRSLCFNGGIPYISFVEADSSSKLVMYKFDGTSWVSVGNAFGPTNSLVPSMSFNMDTAYVVVTNRNNFKTEVYKFNGTSWDQLGVGVGTAQNSGDYKPSISFDGTTPYIAFTDLSSAGENVVYTYNGTSWVKVGNSIGTYGVPKIEVNNGTIYALVRNVSPTIGYSLYTFNGASWVKFDSSFGGQYTGEHSLKFNEGAPYVVFKEGLSSVLSVYKFGPQIMSNSNSFSANTIGTYVVEEMAPNGALTYDTIEVINAPLITTDAAATAVGCTDGNINLTVNGGTPPFTYQWNNGQTSQNLTGISLGYYSVLVTDDLGCTSSDKALVKTAAPVADDFITQNDTALICTANPASLNVNTQMGSEYKWYKVDSLNWQQVGNSFGGNGSQTSSLTIHEGNTYVAFSDGNNGYSTSVYFFNGLTWQQLGGSFGNNNQYGHTIVFNDGIPYVACNDGSNSNLVVYKFDGTNWVQLGSAFGSAYSTKARLVFNQNIPYVAFRDQSSSGKIAVFNFDGASWAQVGSSFGGNYSNDPSLAFNAGTPYVSFSDGGSSGKIAVYTFNGTSWVITGATFGGDWSDNTSLAFNAGAPFIAFRDGSINNGQTSVYRFNGANWLLYGGGRFGGNDCYSQSLYFEGGSHYVAFSEGSNDNQSTVYKYNGSNWVKYGGSFGGESTFSQSLGFTGGIPYVAFLNVDRMVSVFKYDYANIGNQTSTSVYTAGAYVAIETDMNGCMKTDTITVIQQNIQPPVATATAISTSCSNVSSGAINLSVTLGTTPYTYSWSTNETTQNISNLSIGNYSVIVTDSIGCSASAFASVIETPIAQANLINEGDSAFACGNSAANVSVNVQPGYTYKWIELDSLSLQQLGNPFGGIYSYSQSLKINNGISYVAFADADNSFQTSVYMKNGTDWVQVGSPFGGNNTHSQSLYFHNNVAYVAMVNNNDEGVLFSFNGTNWVQLGGAFGVDVGSMSLSFKGGDPYVAFADGDNDLQSSVYFYNGSSWVQLGSSFGGDNSYDQSLSISDTTLYVSFIDPDNDEQVSVYTFDGSSWVKMGSSIGGEYSENQTLAVNNGVPYVAFSDSYSEEDASGKTAVYKFDGADWVQVGNQFGSGDVGSKSISFKDTIPYVAFTDGYDNDHNVFLYYFNGTKWVKASKPIGGEYSYDVSLSFDGEIGYVAFADGNLGGQSVVYKFSPTEISNALSITTTREGKYVVRATDPDGCRLADTVSVVHKDSPAPLVVSTITTTCSNVSTGAINLALSNGTAPYTFNWSNGQTTQNVSLLAIGSYSVIVTDSIGCSVNAKAKVGQTPAASVNIILQGDLLRKCGMDTTTLSVNQDPGTSYQWFKADSTIWQQKGSPFGGDGSAVQRICFDGDIPYVAFRDADYDGEISVYTLSGNDWVQLGSTFGDEGQTGYDDDLTLSLRINEGIPYVAFSDEDDYKISVYKFDGTDWVQVGEKFGSQSDFQSLSFDGNTPYVAFDDDDNNNESSVYFFNGAEWEQLGSSFGDEYSEYQSLEVYNGVPYVAYSDDDNDGETKVFTFNGTDWEQLGNSFGGEYCEYQSLCFNGSVPHVAFVNGDGNTSVYKYDGTDWVIVGAPFGGYGYYHSLNFNDGIPYVALSSENQDYASAVYTFNGTNWVQVGTSFGGESIYQSIAFNNGIPYVAAASSDNDYKTTVYKFAAAEIDNSNTVVTQTPGQYVVQSTNTDGCKANDTVIVVQYLTAGNNTLGEEQTICNGSNPTELLASAPGLGDTASYTFNWYSSTINADSGFAIINGTNNSARYTPSALTQTTWYKRIVNSSVCATDTSEALIINVTADSAGTWTGANNWKWADPLNWTCPSIPTATSRVTIPGTANYMPDISDARQVLDLIIENGAALYLGNNASELSIFGSFIVNDGGQLNDYNGKIIFTGTTKQTIPQGSYYSKVEINNAAGVALAGDVTLNDSLILTNGILQLDSSMLVIEWHAYASKGSPTSYVSTNTAVGKIAIINVGGYGKADTVIVPVGNSTYNPVSLIDLNYNNHYAISVIDSVTNTYTGNTPTGTMFANGVVNRTWIIEQSNPGSADATVTLGWTAASELSGFNRNASFVGYYNDSMWMTGTPSAASGSSVYYQTLSGVSTFLPLAVGSGNDGVLPVQLLSFTAAKQQKDVNVTWVTASELNNDYFELQRSVDGKTFETITKVKGHGTTTAVNNYVYLDTKVGKLSATKIYYRLIQTDFNGTKVTSKTVVVNMGAPTANGQQLVASISPNPFTDITNVNITAAKAEKATLKVTDMQGRLVFEKQVNLQSGENQIIIDELGSAHSGIYFVNIITATESLVQRIAKAK